MYIRFEYPQEDRISKELGPFPFLQLTYDGLRIGPEGDWIAYIIDGDWVIKPDEAALRACPELKEHQGLSFSDIVFYHRSDSDQE